MKISSRVALACAVACGAIVPAAATHSWGGYHWAGNGSNLTLKVNTASYHVKRVFERLDVNDRGQVADKLVALAQARSGL